MHHGQTAHEAETTGSCELESLTASDELSNQFQVKFSNMSELRPLPPDIALWRVEKLRLSKIKQRLQAAGLSTVGNKRTLSKRLQSLAGKSEETESSDASDTERAQSTEVAESHPAHSDESRHRCHRRGRLRSPLSAKE